MAMTIIGCALLQFKQIANKKRLIRNEENQRGSIEKSRTHRCFSNRVGACGFMYMFDDTHARAFSKCA